MITAPELNGKVALVTGAASGIGRETSVALARNGVKVLCFDLADAQPTVNEIAANGGIALAVRGDLSSPDDVGMAVSHTLTQLGEIDIAVNCAGIISNTPIGDLSSREWDRTLQINLTGAFVLTQAVLINMMKRRTGRLILLASIAARTGGVKSGPAYAASKGGVQAMAKWSAQYAASTGVTVNVIAPGPVETPMIAELGYGASGIPLNRMGTPDDIAEAVIYLSSDSASWMTGQTLDINGGLFMN